MSNEITIKADTMSGPQIALLVIGAQLREHPLFESKLLNEVGSYKDGGAVIKHDAADRKAFFRYAAAFAVSHVKQTVLQKLMKTGLAQDYLSRLYTKAMLSEMEAASRFLLSHNHNAQRVADGIFPVANNDGKEEVSKGETSVVKIIDMALEASRERHMPAFASILEARRTAANQRVAQLAS